MWWKKFFPGYDRKPEKEETEEKYIVAKCIGCGQCARGCPMLLKIKVRKKSPHNNLEIT